MKLNNKILLILFCLIFVSCENFIQISGPGYTNSIGYSSEDANCEDYDGDVDYYADSKGIHIRIPLEENKINKIVLYEIQGSTEVQMAKVKPVSRLYNYALDGTPCGEIMYEVKGENKTEKRAFYQTNYLEGTINLDLNFVEPGKNYHFLLCLDEPEIEIGGGGTYYSRNNSSDTEYEEKPKVRYCKTFSQRAADEVFYSDFIKASYNSETDKFTVDPVDIKTLGLPFAIKDYSDITLSASALYKDTLDSKRTPLTVSLAINPVAATETSLSVIAENIEDADYGADYALASISGSIQFKDHLDYQINESSTADEKRAYYTQLYAQKVYTYNCPYISCPSVPATVNFPDKRMNVTVTPEADDNLLSFTLLTDASLISIYRQSAEEKEPFLAGTMSGRFVSGETYTFTDYYAETGKTYTYFVRWNGGRKSKSVSVTTTSGMKYKPNAPVMTYEYDSEVEEGIFTITTNPFTGKLPESYHGTIAFIYVAKILKTHINYKDEEEREYYFHDVFNMLIKDTDTTYQVYKYDLSYSKDYDSEWDGKLIVKEPYFIGQKDENSNDSSSSYSSSTNVNSYYVTITGQKEGITYQHYYLLKDTGSMPVIEGEKGSNSSGNGNKIDINDIRLEDGEEFYTLKPAVEDDYAEIRSITQNADGSVSITVYIPSWTNTLHLEKFMNHYRSGTFCFDVLNQTGLITIIDFDIKAGDEYMYELKGDSVEPDKYRGDSDDWLPEYYSDSEYKKFDKSSEYYLTSLPKVISKDKIEGNVTWSKLPAGYELLNDNITQKEVIKKYDLYDKNSNYIRGSDLKLCVTKFIGMDTSSNIYELAPTIKYTCTQISEDDKYYIDEYGNQTERQYEQNSSELQMEINKSLQTHYYKDDDWGGEKLTQPYFEVQKEWHFRYVHNDAVKGVYTVNNVNLPFICKYGIWSYNSVYLDHVTENKTFTISE